MQIGQAQADVRRVYRGGFAGPLVSVFVWSVANAVFLWGSPGAGMLTLFVGGVLIFPLGLLVLKTLGGPVSLPKGHPSTTLAMQAAFTVPIGFVVAIVLGTYAPALFFPSALIIVGAHYLVFISLYGMKLYAVLAGVLAAVGAAMMFWVPQFGASGGWIGAGVFLIFSVLLYRKPVDEGTASTSHL